MQPQFILLHAFTGEATLIPVDRIVEVIEEMGDGPEHQPYDPGCVCEGCTGWKVQAVVVLNIIEHCEAHDGDGWAERLVRESVAEIAVMLGADEAR